MLAARRARAPTWPTASPSGAPPHLLEELGELAGDRHLAQRPARGRAARASVARTRRGDSKSTVVRGSAHERGQPLRALAPRRGQEALEHEPLGREARQHERRSAPRSARAPPRPRARRRCTPAPAATRDRRCRACRRRSRTRPACRRAPRRTTQSPPTPARCARAPRARDRAAGIPAWVSSARVRRVSSAAITSASRSASTARGERSPRLPIGVPTSTSAPAGRSARSRSPFRHGAGHAVAVIRAPRPGRPVVQAPALERAGLRLDHERAAPRPVATRATAAGCTVRSTHAVRVAERDVDREPHPERCGPGGTGAARARRRRGRARAAPSPRARAVGDLGRRQHVTVAHEPGIHDAAHTLKRISRTSPSTTS